MSITASVNTSQFERAIVEYMDHTRRDVPEVINRACVDILINAARETKKATKTSIAESLMKEVSSTVTIGTKSKTRTARLIYLIINAQQKKTGGRALSNAQMKAAAAALLKKRAASIGYIAYAGWNPALKAFGGRGFGRGAKKPDGLKISNAESGFGLKATVSKAVATLVNCATGAGLIGAKPFQRVMNSKALDMVNYITEKLRRQAESQR